MVTGRTHDLFAARRYNDFEVPKVFAADADGSRLRRLARNGRAPSWSPDGRWIGFLRDVKGYYSTVYVVRPDGSGLRRLSPVRINPGGPWGWSPDGQMIAIEQDLRNAGRPALEFSMSSVVASGGFLEARATPKSSSGCRIASGILYSCGPAYNAPRLCVVHVKTGRIRKTPLRDLFYPRGGLSADGKRVALSNVAGVYVLDVASGKVRRIVKSGYFESWSPDGKSSCGSAPDGRPRRDTARRWLRYGPQRIACIARRLATTPVR